VFTFPVTLFAGRAATRIVGGSGSAGNFSGQSSWSLGTLSIGTADASRYVVVVVGAISGTLGATTISGVTIGGNAATIHRQQNGLAGTINAIAAIAGLAVASGTTAAIAVTTPSQVTNVVAAVYALYDLTSNTPNTTGAGGIESTSVSCTANVLAGAVQIAVGVGNASETQSWSGATKDSQATVLGATASWASGQGATAATPRTFTCSGSSSVPRAICAATWI
jgi:hypothetical protein